MAIQVGGTTVIDNSRELQNIASLDATTEATISAVAGASTTYGAVGTYVFGYISSSTATENSTYSGSSIEPGGIITLSSSLSDDQVNASPYITKGGSALSGTWRAMGRSNAFTSTRTRWTLFVRVS